MLNLTENNRENYYFYIIICLTLLTGGLRLINLGRLSFWSDDVFTYLAVEGILKHGYPRLLSGLVYFKQGLYSYLTALSAIFFGLNEFGLRFPSVLAGTLVVPLTYRLARQLFNRPVAAVAAAFMAFNYWSFEFSREARYYTTLQFFYLLSVYLFYLGFIKEEKKFRPWALVSFVATVLVFRLGLFLILNYLFLILILGWKKTFRRDILWNFLTTGGLFAGILIFEVFFWQVGRHVKAAGGGGTAFLAELFSRNANFFRQYEDLFRRMYRVWLVGVAGYFWELWRRFRTGLDNNSGWTYLLLNFAGPLFLMSFGNAHYQPRYVFFLLPFFAILYSQSIFWLASRPAKISPKYFSGLTLAVFLGLVLITVNNVKPRQLINIIRRTNGAPLDQRFAPSTSNSFHHDFKSGARFVKEKYKPGDLIISMFAAYQHIYTGRVDYWLWTMSEEGWPAFYLKDGRLLDTYTGVPMIRSLEELQIILNAHRGRRVWITSTYSLDHPGHLDSKIKEFLVDQNRNKLVFTNPAGDARVWLWPAGQKSL